MTPTDIIARRALRIATTIAYFSVSWHGQQVVTFIRPFGKAGNGLWLRQILHHPEAPDKCSCPICRWRRYRDTQGIDHMIAHERAKEARP